MNYAQINLYQLRRCFCLGNHRKILIPEGSTIAALFYCGTIKMAVFLAAKIYICSQLNRYYLLNENFYNNINLSSKLSEYASAI